MNYYMNIMTKVSNIMRYHHREQGPNVMSYYTHCRESE